MKFLKLILDVITIKKDKHANRQVNHLEVMGL